MAEPVQDEVVRSLIRRLLAGQPPRMPGQGCAFIYARCSSDPLGRGKSVERQVEDCWVDCERNRWYVLGIYVDNDRSASSYATKDREDYDRMVAEMGRTNVDVLVCWEASRATRDMRTYLDLSELSREQGIKWCFNGSIFDLEDPDDEFRTMLETVLGHREVRKLAKRVKDGIAKAARDGKPHGGPAPYGYFRTYDQRTREFVAQEIDTMPREVFTTEGNVVSFVPAEVVRDIFAKIAGGDSCHGTMKDLNQRGIPGPEGGQWSARRIRSMCLNAAYAGWRVHKGELICKGVWPPLVKESIYRAAKVRLEDPKRKKSRTNKAQNLLSYIATCGVCGNPLGAGNRKPGTDRQQGYKVYHCQGNRCVSVRCEKLDAYVESVIIKRLSDPATLDWLVRPDDQEAQQAAEEAAGLRITVAKWVERAKAGKVDPDEYDDIVGGMRARIAELDKAALPAYIPVALPEIVGERAADAWDALPLPAKRDIVRTIMSIELGTTRWGRGPFDPSRARIGWLLGGAKPAARKKGASAPRQRRRTA